MVIYIIHILVLTIVNSNYKNYKKKIHIVSNINHHLIMYI